MKVKVILTLVLLSLLLSGGQSASAQGRLVIPVGSLAWQSSDVAIDCRSPGLPADFDYEVVTDASGGVAEAGVMRSLLCNYIMGTNSAHPAGAGLPSGMAITIEYSCPAETQERWNTKSTSRDTEIERAPNYVLLRESGEYRGFAGEFTVQERLFALLDTHTVATIVVLTDADPNDPDTPVLSAKAALPAAVALANTYASQANDPACGAPPGAAISVPGVGNTGTSGPGGTRPWENISGAAAAAVAVGAGVVAALAGGLLSGTGAGAAGTVVAGNAPAGSMGSGTVVPGPVAVAVPAYPAVTPSTSPAPYGVAEGQMGAGPPVMDPMAGAGTLSPQDSQAVAAVGPLPGEPYSGTVAATGPAQAPEDAALMETVEAAGATLAVAGPAAASIRSGEAGSRQGQGSDDDSADVEKPCQEAQATLFGLPATNVRKDCSSVRSGMDAWCTGIDFTSNDERGQPANLDFEAGVSGVVTYVGGDFNMIEVRRTDGNRIHYLHASQVFVRVGQQVGPTTKLGRTGGAGRDGSEQYEIHLHIQAIDEQGNLIDPDCALAAGQKRSLRGGTSASPYLERIRRELEDSGRSGEVAQ